MQHATNKRTHATGYHATNNRHHATEKRQQRNATYDRHHATDDPSGASPAARPTVQRRMPTCLCRTSCRPCRSPSPRTCPRRALVATSPRLQHSAAVPPRHEHDTLHVFTLCNVFGCSIASALFWHGALVRRARHALSHSAACTAHGCVGPAARRIWTGLDRAGLGWAGVDVGRADGAEGVTGRVRYSQK